MTEALSLRADAAQLSCRPSPSPPYREMTCDRSLYLDDPERPQGLDPSRGAWLPYTAHPIDITKDEQFAPDFLKISPNNKIPAIEDRETGISLMESGAILGCVARIRGAGAVTPIPSWFR